MRPTHHHEERLVRFDLARDVVGGCSGDVAFHLVTILDCVFAYGPQIALGIGFENPRDDTLDKGIVHATTFHAFAIQRAIGGLDDAHFVLVKALPRWPALLFHAQVPFSGIGCRVALSLEYLCQRDLGRGQRVGSAADDHGVQAYAGRVPPG